LNSEQSLLKIINVSKDYHGIAGAKQHVLQNVNLDVKFSYEKSRLISILAPLGAGKTTLLKIISGLVKPSNGEVNVTGKKCEPEELRGKVVYIPEKASSFPWMNVKQNIIFAFNLKSAALENNKLKKLINLVGLEGYENHFPNDKSLGFRFRISLARALAVEPQILLLDDPFKEMHHEVKKEINELILSLIFELKINIIFATANINNAIFLSDEIYLMKKNPGMIIDKIVVDRLKLTEKNGDYFTSLKGQIEKVFAGHDNSSFISEANKFQV